MSDPKGLKKSRFSPKAFSDLKNLRCETLYIADYEYVHISSFAVLDIKLWLEEFSELDTNHLTKCCHLLAKTLYPTKQTWKVLHIRNQQ